VPFTEPDSTSPPAAVAIAERNDAPAVTVDGQLGLGTPIGALGAWLGYRPVPYLSFQLGAGAEESAGQAQVAAMVRLHTHGPSRFGGAFGPSFGNYAHEHIYIAHPESDSMEWKDDALWLNLHGFWEHEAASGFRFGLLQGFTFLVSPGDALCATTYHSPGAEACRPKRAFIYVGLTLGWAFRL
jgi:hypothetical protein